MHRYPLNNRRENAYFTDGVKLKVINTNSYSDAEFSVPRNVQSTIFTRQTVHRKDEKLCKNEKDGTFCFRETTW